MFSMIPLLGVSLILYTIAAFAIGSTPDPDAVIAAGSDAAQPMMAWFDRDLFNLTVVSGDIWNITYGDAFIIISMVFLFIELLRATNTGTDSLVNHALSALLFIIALILFIIVPGYGNSVFFIFMSMTFLDFMAGFVVTTVTARRDFGVAAG